MTTTIAAIITTSVFALASQVFGTMQIFIRNVDAPNYGGIGGNFGLVTPPSSFHIHQQIGQVPGQILEGLRHPGLGCWLDIWCK